MNMLDARDKMARHEVSPNEKSASLVEDINNVRPTEELLMSSSSISGLFNIYKPAGWTSRDVVNRVERLVKPAKAGHAGTLDPLAEGVLIVCAGAATRLISAVQEREKEYRAVFQLGCRSDTDDNTGQVVSVDVPQPPTLSQVTLLLPQFVGDIQQTPPQFSAVHVDGQRAYTLARQGQTVDIAPRQVRVNRLEIMSYNWPRLELLIECGSGTYVRSIGRDLGELLGCGAVMTELLRTRIGPFLSADAVRIDDLQRDSISNYLFPPVRAVEHWPTHVCSDAELWEIAHGRQILVEYPAGTRIALVGATGDLAALGEAKSLGRVSPTQVFVDRNQLVRPASGN